MQEDAFWSFLEQNWAWNGCYMFGAKGMNEMEDLKKLGFLLNEGNLINEGFLIKHGNLITHILHAFIPSISRFFVMFLG